MFSGLIHHVGRITANKGRSLEVIAALKKTKKGDSIAINGACLTAVRLTRVKGGLKVGFELSPETLSLTTLRNLKSGTPVNIEAALKASDSLGGHIVQGHVDGMGQVTRILNQGDMKTIWFKVPKEVSPYLVRKGSVTVDGVSLTVAAIKGFEFSVALIPYTLRHTTLGRLQKGTRVNLEADVIAKYVSKYAKRKS